MHNDSQNVKQCVEIIQQLEKERLTKVSEKSKNAAVSF